jgi:signal transduction histidine kinase
VIVLAVIVSAVAFILLISHAENKRRIDAARIDMHSAVELGADNIVAQSLYGAYSAIELYRKKMEKDSDLDLVYVTMTDGDVYGKRPAMECIFDENGFCFSKSQSMLYYRYPLKHGEHLLGELVLAKRIFFEDMPVGTYTILTVAVALFLTLALILFFLFFIRNNITHPLEMIQSEFASIQDSGKRYITYRGNGEIQLLISQINGLIDGIRSYEKRERDNEKLAAIGRMSSHIAHDMRSPMSVLSAYVKMKDDLSEEDAQELKGAAERSVAKLARMADELVDYAKADRVAKSKCKLSDLCGAVVEETADEARKERVPVECKCAKTAIANLDGYRIERVLVNLVKNAIQASSGRVVLNADTAEDGELVLTVSDNGKGIPDDDLPHIFDSFFTKGKKGGTGLGLAYCKQVVEAHGGTIGVESEIGKGTTFTIRIPGCVVRKEQDDEHPRRYLIADDDELMRMHWQHIVKQRGGTVVYTAASTGEIMGNESIDYSSIDAAVVDYEFKGERCTGIDLISYLKRKGVRRVHLCTGYVDDERVVEQAKQAGADTVIPKPIDESTLTM